jgi:hypothetical protein
MGVESGDLESSLDIKVLHGDQDVTALFTGELVYKGVPSALWGSPSVTRAYGKTFVELPGVNSKRLLENTPVGLSVRPTLAFHAGGTDKSSFPRNVSDDSKPRTFVRFVSASSPVNSDDDADARGREAMLNAIRALLDSRAAAVA